MDGVATAYDVKALSNGPQVRRRQFELLRGDRWPALAADPLDLLKDPLASMRELLLTNERVIDVVRRLHQAAQP